MNPYEFKYYLRRHHEAIGHKVKIGKIRSDRYKELYRKLLEWQRVYDGR